MFHGSLVALVTPMQSNGDIDFRCLRQLIDWHIAQQTDAIVVVGTTGESPTLTHEERNNVIKIAVEQADGRIPIIAGTGSNSTKKTIEDTTTAMEIGVDACLLVTPYYNRPTQEGLYAHYAAIAAAVPIPQILYNVPKRTGCDLLPETVLRLTEFPNIIGVKEGSPNHVSSILKENNKNSLNVFSGDDHTALEIIRLGGKGVISVAANIVPKMMHELCRAALNHFSPNDQNEATRINQQLQDLYASLMLETNPIPVKWAASTMGLIPKGIRLPLTPLSELHQKKFKLILKKLALIAT